MSSPTASGAGIRRSWLQRHQPRQGSLPDLPRFPRSLVITRLVDGPDGVRQVWRRILAVRAPLCLAQLLALLIGAGAGLLHAAGNAAATGAGFGDGLLRRLSAHLAADELHLDAEVLLGGWPRSPSPGAARPPWPAPSCPGRDPRHAGRGQADRRLCHGPVRRMTVEEFMYLDLSYAPPFARSGTPA